MRQYDVLIAADDKMPAGRDWLLIEHAEGVLLVVRQCAMGSARMMLEAWAGYRSLLDRQQKEEPPTLRVV